MPAVRVNSRMPTAGAIGETLWLSFPKPGGVLSLNDRVHWTVRHQLEQVWQTAAWAAGNNARRAHPAAVAALLQHTPTLVEVELPVAARRRRDPHNFVATVKPIIDGLVFARLWPDDSEEFVRVVDPVFVDPVTSTTAPQPAARDREGPAVAGLKFQPSIPGRKGAASCLPPPKIQTTSIDSAAS